MLRRCDGTDHVDEHEQDDERDKNRGSMDNERRTNRKKGGEKTGSAGKETETGEVQGKMNFPDRRSKILRTSARLKDRHGGSIITNINQQEKTQSGEKEQSHRHL